MFTNRYIFIYASVMVIIVAAILSSAASFLKPFQEQNVRTEKIINILKSASITTEKVDADATYQKYIVEEGQTDSLLGRIFVSGTMADFGVWIFDILTRRWPAFSLKTMFKEIVDLPSEEINTYVEQVMSNPEQVSWVKRFLQTTCPMSPRMVGLDNDLKQLEKVSFTNLKDIRSPTLVIHGTADKDVSFANAEFSASSIPNAKLKRLEGIGHIAWLGEHVAQMNEELVGFVRDSM